MAYADDTAIMGIEREVLQAEPILIQTIKDFDGKVNENKTEGLRSATSADPAALRPDLGEAPAVKHVGAVLSNRAHHVAENPKLGNVLKKFPRRGLEADAGYNAAKI